MYSDGMQPSGPGTGKSHVVKDVIKDELFDQILHWQQGLDYQVVALQAVMANLLKGDTIHHACGIPLKKKRRMAKFRSQVTGLWRRKACIGDGCLLMSLAWWAHRC